MERGQPPIEIAKINTETHVIEIFNLRVMAEFINKRNININAVNQIDLILKQIDLNLLATHPENKAKSIIDLVSSSQTPYTIEFKTNDIVYAKLTSTNGKVTLDILNEKVFHDKSTTNTIEASILQAIMRQVTLGDLKASHIQSYNQAQNPYADHQIFWNTRTPTNHSEGVENAKATSKKIHPNKM